MIVFHYALNALINSCEAVLIFLPVVAYCIIIEILSGFANRRFAKRFGWCGILPLALIGTPIHELSHAIVAILTGHKIKELAIFKPNRSTGELGHITHSWNKRNPFHRYIGNPLIAIAPFFGGSLILFLLTKLLMPQLVASNGFGVLSFDFLSDLSHIKIFILAILERTGVMLKVFFNWRNLTSFRFYIYVFFAFGISLHLTPSKQDFAYFWSSVFGLVFIIILLNLIFPNFIGFLDFRFLPFLLKVYSLLALAAFFSLITFLFSLFTFIV